MQCGSARIYVVQPSIDRQTTKSRTCVKSCGLPSCVFGKVAACSTGSHKGLIRWNASTGTWASSSRQVPTPVILDRHRNAMEQSKHITTSQCGVRPASFFQRSIGAKRHHSIDLRANHCNLSEMLPDNLFRRNPFGSNGLRHGHGRRRHYVFVFPCNCWTCVYKRRYRRRSHGANAVSTIVPCSGSIVLHSPQLLGQSPG